ncbi:MAG TPA: BamA/TamA family outer membrane protein [Candidatus Limnocylindria bacterium]|nr:BamA/TamA family outer membrane protein [Candidatus Limnocylindria bacterium]
MTPRWLVLMAALAVLASAADEARGATAATTADRIAEEPAPVDSADADLPDRFRMIHDEVSEPAEAEPGVWRRAPFGEDLLTDADAWRVGSGVSRVEPLLDYNRVDQLRIGVRYQAQAPDTDFPRLGARLEYPFGRERTLYGIQLEQPLPPRGVLAVGASIVRRTDHSELHQVDDLENTLALLFGRQDYRDYFEREGFGAYLAARIPGISTASVHLRNDRYRSLATRFGTQSWFHRNRDLRSNPPVAEGESRSFRLRLERLAHHTRRTRAGLYHWAELERSGAGLGGDFDYARFLADVRSVLRLSPATTLALRLVTGSALAGDLPPQREFTAGGVDGLRAHAFSQFRGNQVALAQAEYTIGLWRLRTRGLEGGLHAIAFVDAGRAWHHADHVWNPLDQRLAVDGGFGLGTSEDNLRLYLAKNLRDPDSDVVISARLRRPF